jgi:hypothetical protein
VTVTVRRGRYLTALSPNDRDFGHSALQQGLGASDVDAAKIACDDGLLLTSQETGEPATGSAEHPVRRGFPVNHNRLCNTDHRRRALGGR